VTVAVVTGAGSGIGKRVAELLAAAGHEVVGWDVKGTENRCDISDPAAVDDAMATTVAEHGPPSRVVACTGVGRAGMLVDETVQDWNRVIAINLTGTWLTLRAAARAMIATGTPGSMVAVSSISGTVVDRNMGAYCASKRQSTCW
jgi:NAD(P)-dependent dehydrogenase (short-subunit alcohol dehydrogenase family)